MKKASFDLISPILLLTLTTQNHTVVIPLNRLGGRVLRRLKLVGSSSLKRRAFFLLNDGRGSGER